MTASPATADYAGIDGTAWQRLCMQVLHHHHAEDLVPIPDKDNGDAGLEAFTVDGLAYQCYSPEEPLRVEQRYAKHRTKMTTDIGKLIANTEKLHRMLGAVRIRRWILLVPVADSRELVAHATKQVQRIKDAKLAYVADDIYVLARTLDAFQASLDFVIGKQMARLRLPAAPSPDYSIVATDLVETMRGKLGKVPKLASTEKRDRYINSILTSNIGAQSQRAYIRDHYPELDDDLNHVLWDLEQRLETEVLLSDDAPERMLQNVLSETESRVRSAIPSIREGDARVIAEGQVADWLMKCPLDFEDQADPAA